MSRIDLTGQKFGSLTVEKFSHKTYNKNYWECRCDCGNTCTVLAAFLKSGLVKSCGCGIDRMMEEPKTQPVITVGQEVKFDPFYGITGFGAYDLRGATVTGTVVMINHEHKWFSVEYDCGGVKQRTSFNFADIGKVVTVCG